MTDQDPPVVIDPTIPSSARMYDYLLGGKDNFPADRAAAKQLIELGRQTGFDVRGMTRANRAFLVRVVRTLAELGVRQFLTSARVCPPSTTSTRSPSPSPRTRGWPTSTTTRSC
jgi:hypothetical protein